MAKYLFVYHGGSKPDSKEEIAEVMNAWGQWLGSMGSAVIDGGNPVDPSQIRKHIWISGIRESRYFGENRVVQLIIDGGETIFHTFDGRWQERPVAQAPHCLIKSVGMIVRHWRSLCILNIFQRLLSAFCPLYVGIDRDSL